MKTDPNAVQIFFSLAQHIQYQDGSVVSREVFRNKSGTITLFAFDKEQKLSDHKTPFDAFIYLIDGKAEIILEGKKTVIRTGEFFHMPAQVSHALTAITRFKMLLIMISHL